MYMYVRRCVSVHFFLRFRQLDSSGVVVYCCHIYSRHIIVGRPNNKTWLEHMWRTKHSSPFSLCLFCFFVRFISSCPPHSRPSPYVKHSIRTPFSSWIADLGIHLLKTRDVPSWIDSVQSKEIDDEQWKIAKKRSLRQRSIFRNSIHLFPVLELEGRVKTKYLK